MKTNKFEEIIATSITRLKSTLSNSELQSLEQQLSALPKKIKELKADPYLFIFELMLKRKELIEPALTALTTMLDENYLTAPLYDQLLAYLPLLLQDFSYSIVQLISKVKEPHLGFFKLYFDVHSSVALPEDQLKKFKSQGYMWLARAFSLTDRPLDTLAASLYAKFYPEQMPKLLKVEEEEQQIRKYVTLVLDQIIIAVQYALQGGQRGKYGCCFICKQSAQYYCKDTKVPLCSVQCKKGHLELLTKTNSLNFQYSKDFCREIQALLVNNLRDKRSPALSIDFLIAIYQYSSYVPQIELQHARILSQPVIFERIWLLYFSYYGKLGQSFEHIFYSGLTVQNQFLKQMCTQYFILLASEPRLFTVYKAFDRQGDYRLLTSVLRSLDPSRKIQFISSLVETVFNSYSPSSYRIEDQERSIIRALNHQQVLTPQSLTSLFGENAHLKLIRFIMRNELEVNRQKLGEFLFNNEEICRLFLREVVQKKIHAPVDELIREAFFFVNVKISDKIYRFFQLLAQIYEPQPPFNETNFFTYAYFIIMIVTELNNPIVTQKPTMSTILTRVQQFCPDLAKNHAHIIEAMFERISSYPFSQNSRGILAYYPPVAIPQKSDWHVEEIIINNWEFIYEAVLNGRTESIVIYRICSLVVAIPPICQAFLQILVERLTEENRDQFLVKTIANILEQQPNAAGFLWKPILQQVRSSPLTPAPDQFSLSLIIHSSSQLTDDNFYQFVREFSAQFPIINYINYYMHLIVENKMRMGLVSTLLVSNFEKCGNWYLQLMFARKIGLYLEEQPEMNLCSMLLQMLRSIPVNVITEGIMLECLLSIDFEKFPKALDFWTVVSHKCLLFSDDKKAAILEQALRQSRCPQAYESYLIQKTLNCPSQQLISEDILKNLHKLEPYLEQIDPLLLKLFLLRQNLPTVLSNFKYFRNINESYAFIVKQLTDWSEVKLKGVIQTIKDLLKNNYPSILELDAIPTLIVKALSGCAQNFMPLLTDYVRLLEINQSEQQNRVLLMKVTSISILANALVNIISNRSLNLQRQFVVQLIQILQFLHIQSNLFQTNIPLRLEIKKLIQSTHLPSLLKSSLLLCKSRYYLQDSLEHPSEISLIQLLKQVETVVQRQMKISLQEKGAKLSNLQRLQLIQSSKDSMLYGQMMIEASHQYIGSKGSLTSAHRSLLKGIIISILVQGFFNETTSSYDSLADSPIAHKAAQIIHLLNQS